ncbi:MAG: apolipoprotein N-acyltransferase [Deltaproteobacteria bacterium]|jgi:apolipoprotein N-acyltransferase|nr:apolipoprotein N-acyltransferase [Deltaproteobacteria bacterium]
MTALPADTSPPRGPAAALAAAAFGGLAQTLAWPPWGWWPLTFVGPALLWLAVRGRPFRAAFFLGWVYGLALGLSGFSWLASVMSGFGGLGPAGGAAVLVLLAALLALHQGLWAGLVAPWTAPGFGGFLAGPLLGALLWTGLDWLKNWLLTGFNWTPLAGGLSSLPFMLGAADLVGLYGLTLPTALAAFWLAGLAQLKSRPRLALRQAVAGLATLTLLASYGLAAQRRWDVDYAARPKRSAAVLQASVPQDRKWDPRFRDEILARYETLLTSLTDRRPWLTLWPETAAPFIYGLNVVETDWLDGLAAKTGLSFMAGVAAAELDDDGALRLRNRAWLMTPQGPGAFYDKRHLVPFGEYVPLADELPFLKWPFVKGLLGAAGDFSPGRRRPPPVFDGVAVGNLICFESIFPYLARQRVLDGAAFLAVTTNDAWFGRSAAPEQHLAQAVMRAVETRRPLLRAANNGLSALVSPSGRLLARTELDQIGAYVYELGLSDPGVLTFYVRFGWTVAPAAAAATVLTALLRLGRALRARRTTRPAGRQKPARPPGSGRRPQGR